MTLLVGANFSAYTFLAADSLQVWPRPDRTKIIKEEIKKISLTPRGLVAGIGSINVFQPVINQLQAKGFRDEAEVSAFLKASLAQVSSRPDAAEHLSGQRTALFASFVEGKSNLTLFHVDDNFEPKRIEHTLQTLLPDGALPGQNVAEQNALAQSLVAAIDLDDVDALVEAFSGYFRHFRKLFPNAVGPHFQLGLQTADELEITDLMPLESDS